MTVQLTNPNILDLTEWQKVINEINNLSARIDALTTSQGALTTTAVDWNSTPTFSQQFNIGNQKILFGKEKATAATLTKTGFFYEGAVNFSETAGIVAFKAKPIITATIAFAGTSLTTFNPDLTLTIFNPTENGFGYRLVNAGSHIDFNAGSTIHINWIAVGP